MTISGFIFTWRWQERALEQNGVKRICICDLPIQSWQCKLRIVLHRRVHRAVTQYLRKRVQMQVSLQGLRSEYVTSRV